jgi:glycosyltransferase involved in cell wall biosynthesis
VILDLHEILPEFAASKFRGLIARAMRSLALRIERASRRFADATITVNRPIEQLLEGRRAAINERIVVLHNSPDTADFGPLRDPQPRDGLDTLRAVYHGTLTRLYGLDVALDAVNALRAAKTLVTLDIFGDGPERRNLEAKVTALGLGDCVTFHTPVSARELRERLPSFDAGLVPTLANLMTQYSLATKLLEYIHLGIPVVAPALRTYQSYFGPGTLHYFAPNDSRSLAITLAELKAAPAAKRAEQARRAQHVLQEISWEREKPRLLALYVALAAGTRTEPNERRPS